MNLRLNWDVLATLEKVVDLNFSVTPKLNFFKLQDDTLGIRFTIF